MVAKTIGKTVVPYLLASMMLFPNVDRGFPSKPKADNPSTKDVTVSTSYGYPSLTCAEENSLRYCACVLRNIVGSIVMTASHVMVIWDKGVLLFRNRAMGGRCSASILRLAGSEGASILEGLLCADALRSLSGDCGS